MKVSAEFERRGGKEAAAEWAERLTHHHFDD
jgi:hypothetical protein